MGYLATFLSILFGSAKDLVSKKLSFNVHTTVNTFASFAYALPGYFLVMLLFYSIGLEDFSFSGKFFLYVFLRSITDICAEWCKMRSFLLGDISLVSCFFSLDLFFLLFTSYLITGDVIPPAGILGIVVVVLGTLVAAYPIFKQGRDKIKKNISAILMSSLSAFFFSLNNSLDRLAAQNSSPLFSAFTMTFFSCLFLLPLLLKHKKSLHVLKSQNKLFFFRGVLELLFMTSKMTAVRYLPAPYVVGLRKSTVIFSIIGGKLLYNEKDFKVRLLSGLIILVGVFLIIYANL